MEGPMDILKKLDPSDSMARTIEAIDRLLDDIEGACENIIESSLNLISEKEGQAVSYYMRPLDSDSIYNRLIDIYENRQDVDMADRYKSMVDQRRAREWTIRGDLHTVMGNNTLAVKYMERALFYGPRDDVVDEVKRGLVRARKRVARAKEDLPKILSRLEARPDSMKLIGDAARSLMDLNRLDEAISMNNRGLGIDPTDFESLHRRGCLEFLTGEKEKALDTFSRLKEIKPNSTKAKSAYNWTRELIERES